MHEIFARSLFTNIQKHRICLKLTYFLINLQTSRTNNSRVLRIKTAKVSGFCFYMKTNREGDFKIYINVPLSDGGYLIGGEIRKRAVVYKPFPNLLPIVKWLEINR